MNKLLTTAALSAFFISPTVLAKQSFYEFAKVVDVTPIYHYVTYKNPVEKCWTETRRRTRDHHGVDTLAGAIIGGVIGNAIGHDRSSRRAGRVAGAIIGGAVAHEASQETYSTERQEVCKVSHHRSKKVREIKGYHVSYRYDGNIYQVKTKNHPGNRIKVKVNITPVEL